MGALHARTRASFLYLLAVLAVLGSCTSNPVPSGQCVFDSDCTSPQVCAAMYCRAPCATDADCPSGQNCHGVTASGQRVCIPAGVPAPCRYTSDCTSPEVCTSNGLCQVVCEQNYDCQVINPHETCQSGACVLNCPMGTGNCDTNPVNGCETDVLSSSTHCGACGTVCPMEPNSTPVCTMGQCLNNCLPGFANCDGDATNGCETDLSQPSHCGSCSQMCSGATAICGESTNPSTGAVTYACVATCTGTQQLCGLTCTTLATDPNNCGSCGNVCPATATSSASCVAGVCHATCLDPTVSRDCDGVATNGCEVMVTTDPSNCGTCGTVCPTEANGTPACTMGACGVACSAGFGNCDNDPTNGCEVNLQTTPSSCGSCTTLCPRLANSTPACASGACANACSTGFGDCDGDPTNGCETDIRITVSSCGACGNACPVPANSTATCALATCGYSCNTGFADCNGLASDGCEVNLGTDTGNCGMCGSACSTINNTPVCTVGVCSVTCMTGFGNCDGMVSNGCETNLTTNTLDCGACGMACAFPSGGGSCSASTCHLSSCTPGRGDCDGIPSNGCETNITTSAANCGACGNACALPNATSACVSSACTIATCNTGFADCDLAAANGCEVNTTGDPAHCGACGTACSTVHGTATCTGSACGIRCTVGFGNCDGSVATGCETNLLTTVADCGACGTACALPNASPVCTAGACAIGSCNAGFADCDHNPANGCEVNTNTTLTSCGTCGNTCSYPNGVPACMGGTCSLSSCLSGYGNCDGLPANGCEVNLQTSTASCGSCGMACAPPHSVPSCVAGVCHVGTCTAGWGDCDGVVANGCETNLLTSNGSCGTCGTVCAAGTLCSSGSCSSICASGFTYCPAGATCNNLLTDTSNCGSCGHSCPGEANSTATCVAGTCGIACSSGFGNCDGVLSNGCETNVTTSLANCGGCGMACSSANGTASCSAGTCGIVCSTGFGNCDGNARLNGCEAPLNTITNCGTCGTACNPANATGVCNSLPTCAGCYVCAISACTTGFADCDGTYADGCEVNTTNTFANCGTCGNSCSPLEDRYDETLICQASLCTPANDHCAGATSIDLTIGPSIQIPVETINATHDFTTTCGSGGGADVFYTFTLTDREMVYADTFGTGSAWDSVLQFASNCTTPVAAGTTPNDVPCNDDAISNGCTSPDLHSQVVAVLGPGTYYLVVSGFSTSTGNGTLSFMHYPVGNGVIVQAVPTGTGWSTTGTTAGTGVITGTCGGAGPEDTYWFMSCPENTGDPLMANTCPTTETVPFTSVLYLEGAVAADNACNHNTSFCGDDPEQTASSYINAQIPAGAGIRIIVVDSLSTGGVYSLFIRYPFLT